MNRLMVLALAGMTLSASYVSGATAQGRGNGRGKAQARPEVYDRDCEVRYDRNGSSRPGPVP